MTKKKTYCTVCGKITTRPIFPPVDFSTDRASQTFPAGSPICMSHCLIPAGMSWPQFVSLPTEEKLAWNQSINSSPESLCWCSRCGQTFLVKSASFACLMAKHTCGGSINEFDEAAYYWFRIKSSNVAIIGLYINTKLYSCIPNNNEPYSAQSVIILNRIVPPDFNKSGRHGHCVGVAMSDKF